MSLAALDLGKSKLMGANGRLSWIVSAEALFRDVVEHNPENPAAHYWLGLAICYQGRAPDAITQFRTAIELHDAASGPLLQPAEYADSFERLGDGLMHANRLDEAETVLARAAELQPAGVGTRLNSAKYMLDGLQQRRRAKSRRQLARWPVKVSELASLEQAIDHATTGASSGEPFLYRESTVSTLGSCFALNIAHALKSLGLQVHGFGLGELINSTYSNRALLAWISNSADDSFEPSVVEVLRAYFGKVPDEAKRRLQESQVVIFTLGVGAGFFDRETGRFHLTQPGSNTLHLLNEKEFRTTTVAENVFNIRRIVTFLRILNPNVRIVFTVSPVPLYSTFEYSSAVIADCVSKSTLRAAIDEFIKSEPEGVHYWPAFEIVRWLGAYHGPMYGAEDGTSRHVSEQVVTAIVRKFIEVHGSPDLVADLHRREA